MGLRDKFRVLAGSLLLVLAAGAAFAAPAPTTGSYAQTRAQLASGHLDPGVPEPVCVENHYRCEPGAIATALAQPAAFRAIPPGGLVKPATTLRAPGREAVPPRAASISILFRNFRE